MAKGAESVAEVLGEISRDHLECSICHERYQTPKILHCLHSFCEKCLLTYQKSAKSSSVIECPVCRQLSALTAGGARELKTNFHLMEIVADVSLKEKLSQKEGLRLLCELCEDEREAQSRCMECSFLLCRQCQAAHRRIVATANHEVLSLDALRSGEANLKRKAVEPPCEKHQGEKKRFFCETCSELICRDCTVVEHREHKFTTIDDAASRLRQNTKELIAKLRKQLSAFENTRRHLGKMDTDLNQSVSSVQKSLDQQAVQEDKRISQYESNALEDIRNREHSRDRALQENGVSLGKQAHRYYLFQGKQQNYCKAEEEAFSTIDNTLIALNKSVETLLTTKEKAHALMDDFKRKVRQDASSDKSKVVASKTKLRAQLDILSNQKKNFIKESDKITSAHISRMHHTLDIAGDLVESASNVDFLNLQSVIDGDINELLKLDLPKLHPGYANLEFKSSCGTGLGKIIAGATWIWERDIVPCSGKRDGFSSEQRGRHYNPYANPQRSMMHESPVYHHGIFAGARDSNSQKQSESQIIITSIDAFRKNEILVGCGAHRRVLAYNTSGKRTMETEVDIDKVASLADDSFITLRRAGRSVRLFPPNSTSPKKEHRIPDSAKRDTGDPVSISGYGDEDYVVCCSNLESVLVVNSSTGSLVRQLPVGIKPDFLASRSKGQILLGSRSAARGEVVESNGATAFNIPPTAEGCLDRTKATCAGVCCDKEGHIYMAVHPPFSTELHIHQYSPAGLFVGCSVFEKEKPIVDITVTGDGKLVLAEENSLKLFVMTS